MRYAVVMGQTEKGQQAVLRGVSLDWEAVGRDKVRGLSSVYER